MLTCRMLAGAMFVVACSVAAAAQQPAPPINYFGSGDLALSTFVRGSYFRWQTDEMLIVLWRGGERWHSRMKSGGSGTAAGYTGFMEFGSRRIDFSYDRSRRIARIQELEVSMADGHNVLLVDGVDRAGGLSAKSIRADLTLTVAPARGTPPPRLSATDVASMLQRSEEITAFLRCDTPDVCR